MTDSGTARVIVPKSRVSSGWRIDTPEPRRTGAVVRLDRSTGGLGDVGRDGAVSDASPDECSAHGTTRGFEPSEREAARLLFDSGCELWGTPCPPSQTIRIYRRGSLFTFDTECASRNCHEHGFERRLFEAEAALCKWRHRGRPDLSIYRVASQQWESLRRQLGRKEIPSQDRLLISMATKRVLLIAADTLVGGGWPDPEVTEAADVPRTILRLFMGLPIRRVDPSAAEAQRREQKGDGTKLASASHKEHDRVWKDLRQSMSEEDWPYGGEAPSADPNSVRVAYKEALARIRDDPFHLG